MQEADGRVVFEMKRAYADGTAARTPEELVSRLVAIVPPAGAKQIVYRGVLAGVPPTGGPAFAKMALRHGMEGGPTTGRVLAGLIRPRVSQTRATMSAPPARARPARPGPMAGTSAGTSYDPVWRTVAEWCVRRVEFEVNGSRIRGPDTVRRVDGAADREP